MQTFAKAVRLVAEPKFVEKNLLPVHPPTEMRAFTPFSLAAETKAGIWSGEDLLRSRLPSAVVSLGKHVSHN